MWIHVYTSAFWGALFQVYLRAYGFLFEIFIYLTRKQRNSTAFINPFSVDSIIILEAYIWCIVMMHTIFNNFNKGHIIIRYYRLKYGILFKNRQLLHLNNGLRCLLKMESCTNNPEK